MTRRCPFLPVSFFRPSFQICGKTNAFASTRLIFRNENLSSKIYFKQRFLEISTRVSSVFAAPLFYDAGRG
jgi:hypothetical protein